MSHHQRSSQQIRHKLKAPRDQSPPAPPATLKAHIQPIVFNIVFYPHSTFSLFPQVNHGRATHQLQVKVQSEASPIKANNSAQDFSTPARLH